ncbi:PhzF family phenazine biosynthesis protein [Halorussus halobius]|uniref:PhzF family phenazine biosynthesis protein n=1 Tax=Halorussus halobius TaxID=1710537 RepID=UPI001091DDA3|nr:PhzF family phenazine biosynthesis protein [Halorussus halobius]
MDDNERRVRVRLVDAFTDDPFAGNAAGVVPEADDLTESQMQAVANELGASETAFLRESDRADRRVRYFTPTTEVDLCGHATVGLHAHLFEDGTIEAGTHSLETNVGVLDVDVTDDGTVWMTQDDPEVRRVDLDRERLADALGVDPAALADVGADLPMAVATTGLPFLAVPVNFLEHVSGLDPDLGAVEALSREIDATGIYAFTFDALGADSTLHGRMFAPAAGVPEDPVTGTASGAVGAYLREYEVFDGDFPEEMVFEQGHFVDRPGYVRVRVGEQVRVGGQAAVALDGELRVPGDDEEEFIDAT